ncbi:MAG: translation elongation factor Ts [Candidatus Peregrinibacteria bacterium]|nr:translation elongation factor Ts [Candidatus Peregrinibacteria bacterium]MDZ4245120.1 translation elongation factor Ts [Candidatus Gracilibacteria bacterium]
MTVTLDQIKELRGATGISTMQCKKALESSGGDVDAAIDALRKKGELKSAERADRKTSEGVIAIAEAGNKAAMIMLACETDFVARNDDFIAIAEEFANKVLSEGESVDLSAEMGELNIKMGERVEIADMKIVEAPVLGSYIHSNKKIGVIIGLSGGTEEQAKNVAMHAAANNPKVISPDEISEDVIAKEKEIWTEQLKNEGKPENIMANILIGKEKKFREEGAILTQPFVMNPEQTVKQYLEDATVEIMLRFAL